MKKLIHTLLASVFSIGAMAQALPAQYVQTTVISGLRYPVAFAWTPDGRYLVTQKGDNTFPAANAFIKIFSSSGTALGNFYDLTSLVDSDFERGLLGIAVDPNFATNHYVYAYYDYRNAAQNDLRIRVVRFTEVSNVGTAPTLILDHQYATSASTYPGNHFGGIIGFRPSEPDKLYIEIGDLAYNQGNPTLNYANKLTNPYGKILRINTDGTIPTTNPYYDDGNPATGNDDRIWSYGHRNTFGMCFNPNTDSMYVSENGWNTWDEFNIIHKGGNYGWATCEGNYVYNTSTPCTGFINPIADWGTPLPAVTGCVYYTSSLMPEFQNHILVVDNDYGRIYDMTMGNAPAYDIVTSKVTFADITATGGLTDIKQGAEGCLYALKGGYTTAGAIYRICPVSMGTSSLDKVENLIGQNYPNPTNGKTDIDYSIAQAGVVTIDLYDVTGRKVKSILNAEMQAGKYTATVADLNLFADGSYFYKMDVKQNGKVVYSETKRLMVVK
jgi:glucose/arabinose dehydrogenase